MRQKLAAAAAEASRLQRLRTEQQSQQAQQVAHQQAAMVQVPRHVGREQGEGADHSGSSAASSELEVRRVLLVWLKRMEVFCFRSLALRPLMNPHCSQCFGRSAGLPTP